MHASRRYMHLETDLDARGISIYVKFQWLTALPLPFHSLEGHLLPIPMYAISLFLYSPEIKISSPHVQTTDGKWTPTVPSLPALEIDLPDLFFHSDSVVSRQYGITMLNIMAGGCYAFPGFPRLWGIVLV